MNNYKKSELIARSREWDGKTQALREHLLESAQWSKKFAEKIGLSEIGELLGLLHDFGKASDEFQGYIRSKQQLIKPGEEGYIDAKRGEVDHSTAGAQLAYAKLSNMGKEGKILAQYISLVIASHHTGLIDCIKPNGENEFDRRISKSDHDTHLLEVRTKMEDIEKQVEGLISEKLTKDFFKKIFEDLSEPSDSKQTLVFKQGLLARFLLSCLLDADRLSSADFEKPNSKNIRNYGEYIGWDILIERLESKFDEFSHIANELMSDREREVNQLRGEVAQACLQSSRNPQGIFQLSVPTGGGKTLASLRFALHHAKEHNLDRIFYIAPYITIIDQNARQVREILKDVDQDGIPLNNVLLEHHSNFVPQEDGKNHHSLLAENWDAPLVFTTQVQFLESLFGFGTRDNRRMHQLANSVIILDEVQMIPVEITNMFTVALRFLVKICGASIVLCTATQPPLDNLPQEYRELHIPDQNKIIKNEESLFRKLKRVEVQDARKPGGMENNEIVDLAESALQEKGSVLIVVNTRAQARSLYKLTKDRQLAATYHLSTDMCPSHRLNKLDEIKKGLKANVPLICVSTQLIEAGVDIDFGSVIRSLAGLDSIAQSAGRCNRHGSREGLGKVWVVNPAAEDLGRLTEIRVGSEHAQRMFDDFNDDPDRYENDRIGLNAIERYYQNYYQSNKNKLDFSVNVNSSIGRDDNLFNLLSVNELSVTNYYAVNKSFPDSLLRQSFRSAYKEFRVIDSPTRGVIVPYKDGIQLITKLCGLFDMERKHKLLREAQRFSVNLYEHQLITLMEKGAVREVQEGAGVLYLDERFYCDEYGWSAEPLKDQDFKYVS